MTSASALSLDAPGNRPWIERAMIFGGLIAYAALIACGWWAVRLLPDALSLTIFGRVFQLREVHHRIISDGLLVFLILPAALWIECMTVGWRRSSARQLVSGWTPSVRTDLAVLALGQGHVLDLAGRVMMLGASLISGVWVRDQIAARTGFAVDPSAIPMPLQVVIYFFVYTFFDYWTHRLDHARWFWPLHRYHHSARDFSVITAARVHPAVFTGIFMVNVPMAVLGAPLAVMLYVNVIVVSLGFLLHSKIDSDWGWFGRYVIQSPVHHRRHHKLDMSKPTGHFAMAPVWDHLFGTWGGEADQTIEIGVAAPYRHGFWVIPDLLRDYGHFWKGLFRRLPDEG